MFIPPEICDAVISQVEALQYDDRSVLNPDEWYSNEFWQTLATLRLVNKTFSDSASPHLFRIIPVRPDRPLLRLVELSRSPYCEYVQRVEVCFGSAARFHDKIQFKPEHKLYMEDLAALLPMCLSNFRNLASLSIEGPYFTSSHGYDPKTPYGQITAFTSTAVNILRYVPLPRLTGLNIAFPITHEFGQFFGCQPSKSRIPTDHVIRQLRRLTVRVLDNTGQHGQRYYHNPLSAVKATFPNTTFAHHLFKFVELAENLETLQIYCTDVLDLDGLDLSSLRGLRCLSLYRVSISYENFLALIQRCKKTLARFELDFVELNSGRWQDLLVEMCQLPSIHYCYIDSCGYSVTGRSSDVALHLWPDIDNPQCIESSHFGDNFALGDLQRQVNLNRSALGLPKFPEYTYRFLTRQPLDFMLQRQEELMM